MKRIQAFTTCSLLFPKYSSLINPKNDVFILLGSRSSLSYPKYRQHYDALSTDRRHSSSLSQNVHLKGILFVSPCVQTFISNRNCYQFEKKNENLNECINKKSKESTVMPTKENSQKPKLWTIPNMLTLTRISFSPLLSYQIIHENYAFSLALLIGLGITDFFDGYIARNFQNQASDLGTFLDPLGDKVLIITLYSSMTYMHLLPSTLMYVVILRDVLLLSAASYIRFMSITPPRTVINYFDISTPTASLHPTMISKVNTAIQLMTALVSLYAPIASCITHNHLLVLWYTAGVSTVISGLSYIGSKDTYVLKTKNSLRK